VRAPSPYARLDAEAKRGRGRARTRLCVVGNRAPVEVEWVTPSIGDSLMVGEGREKGQGQAQRISEGKMKKVGPSLKAREYIIWEKGRTRKARKFLASHLAEVFAILVFGFIIWKMGFFKIVLLSIYELRYNSITSEFKLFLFSLIFLQRETMKALLPYYRSPSSSPGPFSLTPRNRMNGKKRK
jgi:hypothetical protein